MPSHESYLGPRSVPDSKLNESALGFIGFIIEYRNHNSLTVFRLDSDSPTDLPLCGSQAQGIDVLDILQKLVDDFLIWLSQISIRKTLTKVCRDTNYRRYSRRYPNWKTVPGECLWGRHSSYSSRVPNLRKVAAFLMLVSEDGGRRAPCQTKELEAAM